MALPPRGKVSTTDVTVASSGLVPNATPASADPAIFFDSGSGNAISKATLANLAAVVNAKAQMPDDDAHSIFVVTGTHDFGQTDAKDTDLGALGVKASLIGGIVTMSEVMNGTSSTETIVLSSAAAGATPIASTLTITMADTVYSNLVGAAFGVAPLAAGVDMASTDHVYAYTSSDASRTTGIAYILLFFQKSA